MAIGKKYQMESMLSVLVETGNVTPFGAKKIGEAYEADIKQARKDGGETLSEKLIEFLQESKPQPVRPGSL